MNKVRAIITRAMDDVIEEILETTEEFHWGDATTRLMADAAVTALECAIDAQEAYIAENVEAVDE